MLARVTQLPPQTPLSVARYGTGVPTPPPKAKTPTWVIIAGTVLVVCCVIPMILGVIGQIFGTDKPTDASDQSTAAPPVVVVTDSPAPATTSAAPPPPPAGPLTNFGTGMYEVGVDIKAGTYTCTATGILGGYWERARNASGEFSAIIANDAFDGKSIVTVKAKEFFKVASAECTIRG